MSAPDDARGSRVLIACSVRGDTVHARLEGERRSLCGVRNVNVVDDPFRQDMPWACPRCRKLLVLGGYAEHELDSARRDLAALRERYEALRTMFKASAWITGEDADRCLDATIDRFIAKRKETQP